MVKEQTQQVVELNQQFPLKVSESWNILNLSLPNSRYPISLHYSLAPRVSNYFLNGEDNTVVPTHTPESADASYEFDERDNDLFSLVKKLRSIDLKKVNSWKVMQESMKAIDMFDSISKNTAKLRGSFSIGEVLVYPQLSYHMSKYLPIPGEELLDLAKRLIMIVDFPECRYISSNTASVKFDRPSEVARLFQFNQFRPIDAEYQSPVREDIEPIKVDNTNTSVKYLKNGLPIYLVPGSPANKNAAAMFCVL